MYPVTLCVLLFTVLPLNTENVASVFQIVPLNKMYGVFSFGDRLEIPDELQSQPLKAAGWYVDEGKRFGWRWIVVSLDLCNETNVSDYLLPYVESPAGVMSYIFHLYMATEFQETSGARHQCCVRMTCKTPTLGHSSTADIAW